MSTMKRFDAVSAIADRMTPVQELRVPASFDDYAENVFDKSKMLARLTKATARKLLATIEGRQPLDPSIADEIAKAMKEFAATLLAQAE